MRRADLHGLKDPSAYPRMGFNLRQIVDHLLRTASLAQTSFVRGAVAAGASAVQMDRVFEVSAGALSPMPRSIVLPFDSVPIAMSLYGYPAITAGNLQANVMTNTSDTQPAAELWWDAGTSAVATFDPDAQSVIPAGTPIFVAYTTSPDFAPAGASQQGVEVTLWSLLLPS